MAYKIIITSWDLTIAKTPDKRASKLNSSLTKLQAVIDDVKAKRPTSVAQEKFFTISIDEGGEATYKTEKASSSFTFLTSFLDPAKLTALVNEVQALPAKN
jgi:hypothetical protein